MTWKKVILLKAYSLQESICGVHYIKIRGCVYFCMHEKNSFLFSGLTGTDVSSHDWSSPTYFESNIFHTVWIVIKVIMICMITCFFGGSEQAFSDMAIGTIKWTYDQTTLTTDNPYTKNSWLEWMSHRQMYQMQLKFQDEMISATFGWSVEDAPVAYEWPVKQFLFLKKQKQKTDTPQRKKDISHHFLIRHSLYRRSKHLLIIHVDESLINYMSVKCY